VPVAPTGTETATEPAPMDSSAANVTASVLRMDRAAVPSAKARLASVAAAMAGGDKASPATAAANQQRRDVADFVAAAPALRADARFANLRAAASNRAAGQEQKIKGAEPVAIATEAAASGDPVAAAAPSNAQVTTAHGTDTPASPLMQVDSPRNAVAQYHRVEDATARFTIEGSQATDQLSIRLLHAAADGRRGLQVHLHPAELGSVDVKMQWQGDRMTAQFVVDRPETLDMLRRDMPALERTLNQAGVNVDAGGLSFSLRQQQANTGNGQGSASASAGLDGADGAAGAAQDMPLGQIIRDGILSIRV
jgi:flagellar hook-length control protein FliK